MCRGERLNDRTNDLMSSLLPIENPKMTTEITAAVKVKDKLDQATMLLGKTYHDPGQALRMLEEAQAMMLGAGVVLKPP